MVVSYQKLITDTLQDNLLPNQKYKANKLGKELVDWQVAAEKQFKKQIIERLEETIHDESFN